MKKTQTYKNHAHVPVASTMVFVLASTAIVASMGRWLAGWRVDTLVLLCLSLAAVVLALISRTYVTRLQDRIIRLEMRVRGASVLTPEQQRMLQQLTIKQVAALRFASDAEMGALVERAAREQLAPGDIKKAVKSWTPDWDRT